MGFKVIDEVVYNQPTPPQETPEPVRFLPKLFDVLSGGEISEVNADYLDFQRPYPSSVYRKGHTLAVPDSVGARARLTLLTMLSNGYLVATYWEPRTDSGEATLSPGMAYVRQLTRPGRGGGPANLRYGGLDGREHRGSLSDCAQIHNQAVKQHCSSPGVREAEQIDVVAVLRRHEDQLHIFNTLWYRLEVPATLGFMATVLAAFATFAIVNELGDPVVGLALVCTCGLAAFLLERLPDPLSVAPHVLVVTGWLLFAVAGPLEAGMELPLIAITVLMYWEVRLQAVRPFLRLVVPIAQPRLAPLPTGTSASEVLDHYRAP